MIGEECSRVVRAINTGGLHIIHHWDTDGIASAALVIRRTKNIAALSVPKIGSYTWRALPQPVAERVLVLDYGIQGKDYESYASSHGIQLYVVDHHRVDPPGSDRVTYCNPPAYRLGGEGDYPSCALTLARLYDNTSLEDMLLAALGTVGDLAPQLDAGVISGPLQLARTIAEKAGYTLEQLRRASEVLDASYKLLDIECIRKSVIALATDGLKSALQLECAIANHKRSQTLVREALASLKLLFEGRILEIYRLDMDALITSTIGRKLASQKPSKVIALFHTMPSERRGYLYIRSIKVPLGELRGALEGAGLRVGGKSSVLVVEYSQGDEHKLMRLLQAWDDHAS